MKTKSLEGSLYFSSNLSAESQFASATTINSGNFYGFFDPKYIGTGNTPNWVTNQELTFLTGLTSNTQTQIIGKASKDNVYITYEDNQSNINYRFLTSGYNTTVSSDTNYYYANIELSSLEVGVIYDYPSGDNDKTINNYSPTGWNDGYPNNATEIRMVPTRTIILTGISGGTNGRICVLRNLSKHLIILSNSSLSNTSNRFILPNSYYFLRPTMSVTFIYTSGNWTFLNYDYNNGMDFTERFNNYKMEFATIYWTFSQISFPVPAFFDYLSLSGHVNNILPATRNVIPFHYQGGLYIMPRNLTTSPSTWGWSLSNNDDKSLYYSGNTNTIFFNTGLLLNTPYSYSGTPALVYGWQNLKNSIGYSAATNSLTSFPNFNGGIFFIMDTRFSNSVIYCVQTNDGSSITGNTSISNMIGDYSFGIHTINFSGDSYGLSTFFTYNPSVQTMKIEAEVPHTGHTLNSNYGYWGFNNGRVTNSVGLTTNSCLINLKNVLYGNNELN
jgi:hypothetical protein